MGNALAGKRAPRRMQHSGRQQNLSALIENTTDSIWSVDCELRLITFNSYFSEGRAWKLTTQPQSGMTLSDLFEPVDWPAWRGWYARALSGERFVTDYSYDCSDDRRYFEIALNPIGTGPMCTGVTAFAREVTERRRAAEELAERAELAALTDSVSLAATRGNTLQGMLGECAEALARHPGVALVRVWTLNSESDVLELRAGLAGLCCGGKRMDQFPQIGESEIGLIARSRQARVTFRCSWEETASPRRPRFGLRRKVGRVRRSSLDVRKPACGRNGGVQSPAVYRRCSGCTHVRRRRRRAGDRTEGLIKVKLPQRTRRLRGGAAGRRVSSLPT